MNLCYYRCYGSMLTIFMPVICQSCYYAEKFEEAEKKFQESKENKGNKSEGNKKDIYKKKVNQKRKATMFT